jgi:hypothetical protein
MHGTAGEAETGFTMTTAEGVLQRTVQDEGGAGAPKGFLSPYRVLDLSNHRGLLAGNMLAKLGADVIQVEPPQGSPARGAGPFASDAGGVQRSLYWAAYAAGKRGITCNPHHPAGLLLLHRLVAQADFLIDSEDSGSAVRRLLDYATLSAINPRLIHVSITAFGSDGPKASDAASDLTLWAAGGPLLQTREAGNAPLRMSVPQSWLHAAADAAGGALVAHFARLASGRGQHVDVSAQQSVAQATLSSVLSAAVGHDDFSIRPVARNDIRKAPDLSGSGARTRRSKWRVRDGLVELHLAMGPAAGRFTNNLFAWMHEEGACDADMAAWDWITIASRIERDELDDNEIERARDVVATFLAPAGTGRAGDPSQGLAGAGRHRRGLGAQPPSCRPWFFRNRRRPGTRASASPRRLCAGDKRRLCRSRPGTHARPAQRRSLRRAVRHVAGARGTTSTCRSHLNGRDAVCRTEGAGPGMGGGRPDDRARSG